MKPQGVTVRGAYSEENEEREDGEIGRLLLYGLINKLMVQNSS